MQAAQHASQERKPLAPIPRGTVASASLSRDHTQAPSAAALKAAAEAAAPGGVWNMGPSGVGSMGGGIMATAAKSRPKRVAPTAPTKEEEEPEEGSIAAVETKAEGSAKVEPKAEDAAASSAKRARSAPGVVDAGWLDEHRG